MLGIFELNRNLYRMRKRFRIYFLITLCYFGLCAVILMICVTRVAKSALDKALAENEDIDDIISPELPIVDETSPNLNQPLIIKIDSAEDSHEK